MERFFQLIVYVSGRAALTSGQPEDGDLVRFDAKALERHVAQLLAMRPAAIGDLGRELRLHQTFLRTPTPARGCLGPVD